MLAENFIPIVSQEQRELYFYMMKDEFCFLAIIYVKQALKKRNSYFVIFFSGWNQKQMSAKQFGCLYCCALK